MTLLSEIAKELGRRGGEKTVSKYGRDHFRRIGEKSKEARRKKKLGTNLAIDNRSQTV